MSEPNPVSVQPSSVQPSSVQPSSVQPSSVQPSAVQSSAVQSSVAQPSSPAPSTPSSSHQPSPFPSPPPTSRAAGPPDATLEEISSGLDLIWLDGRLVPAAGPHLPVTDRGFQLGDGVFETLRARRGIPIEWEEHADRLAESAAALELALPYDASELRAAVAELLRATGLDGTTGPTPGDAALRITVSRGPVAARGTLPPGWRDARATVVIQAWPHRPPSAAILARGLRAVTSRIRRDPNHPLAAVKTTSRADHVYARLEAERAGVDDALFLATDGRLAEATSANIVLIEGRCLRTPSLKVGILAGTTRAWLLRSGAVGEVGLVAVEGDCWPADLARAEEAFLCSSVAGIVPLVEVDGRPIGDGRPGQRTLAIRAAREAWIDAASHGEP